MPQPGTIVGIDIAKLKADACIRSLAIGLSQPSTPQEQQAMVAWLRQHAVATAVMEASGGYERGWAEALRQAGIAVRIVDPKRVRYFAKSAGRLAKNDPIRACPRAGQRPDPGAEMIAWFAETFAAEAPPAHDPERELLDRLMTARRLLVGLATQIRQLGEHRPPLLVAAAQRALLTVIRAQLRRLEAAIQAKIKAHDQFAGRAAIIASVPGFGRQLVAGVIAWLPELGHIDNRAAAALVGVAPYDDDSGERCGERHIKGGRREIRDLLYMATLAAATRHNPVIKAYYQRLRRKGKKPRSSWSPACAS